MPKTRKFIDKKKAVTFQLVHRSQQDPLIADENAPQHVLVQVPNKQNRGKRIKEQHKYGIFFSDDTDYLAQLKDSSDHRVEWPEYVEKALEEKKVKIDLPEEVFASKHEDKDGMLSRAAPISGPQLHLDPDLVAAMDEDFDYGEPDNELEDNFIELAEGVASDQEFHEEFKGEEMDEVGSLPGSMQSFDEEETKSRFTSYSMTSSVIRRNDQLTLLDDRFEKMYADYDENEIGALDCEEIEGHVLESSDILLQYADEFERSKQNDKLDKEVIWAEIAQKLGKESDEEEVDVVEVKEKGMWDCESILSTYSNIYNHPKLIKEPSKPRIEVSRKTGIPLNIIDSNKLTKRALDRLNEEYEFEHNKGGTKSTTAQSVISQLSVLSIRPHDESPEKRRERKKMLKDYKKERRLEKKANTLAFKEESKRQAKIAINNRNNVQGNKIL